MDNQKFSEFANDRPKPRENTNLRLSVWKTGHPIADTVADALVEGFGDVSIRSTSDISIAKDIDAQLGYGILRRMDKVFKTCSLSSYYPWFNIDRGYWDANHFDGNYRISYKGTQAKWHEGIPQADVDIKLEDWKEDRYTILVCPPTDAVMDFFDIRKAWFDWYYKLGEQYPNQVWKVRRKEDTAPMHWDNIKAVVTFNSSMGWQALERGIPCISDTTHSIVGSYYKHELDKKGLDYNFDNIKLVDREPLFKAMRAHQFTLAEIREGRAWSLIQHYLSI